MSVTRCGLFIPVTPQMWQFLILSTMATPEVAKPQKGLFIYRIIYYISLAFL